MSVAVVNGERRVLYVVYYAFCKLIYRENIS